MEKLTRLTVAGFRSLRSVELSMRDLTVLIGANGCGKSNLVATFNMLSFMLSGDLQHYVGRKGGGSSILHYGPKVTPVLHVELAFEGSGNRSEYAFSLAFGAPNRLIFTEERVAFHRANEPQPYSKSFGSGHGESMLVDLAKTQSRVGKVARVFLMRLKQLQVYHFHDTSETAQIRASQDSDRNQFLLSKGGNLAAFLYLLQEKYPQHYERILATVRLVIPYLRDLVLAPDRMNEHSILLRWRDHNPDYEFGPHQLSDGSLRAIALITALLQPEEFLPWLLVIDEPELGLHPGAIATIAQLIQAASTKRQVIVATQSPRLLATFAPEDVAVMEREQDKQGLGHTLLRRLSKSDLGSWLNDYDLGQLYDMNVTGGAPQ